MWLRRVFWFASCWNITLCWRVTGVDRLNVWRCLIVLCWHHSVDLTASPAHHASGPFDPAFSHWLPSASPVITQITQGCLGWTGWVQEATRDPRDGFQWLVVVVIVFNCTFQYTLVLSQSYATNLYRVLSLVEEQAVHLLKYNILFYLYSQQDPNFLQSRFCPRDWLTVHSRVFLVFRCGVKIHRKDRTNSNSTLCLCQRSTAWHPRIIPWI